MSIPARLIVKFDEAWGREAAEDLVTVFEGLRADVAEVRQQIVSLEQRLDARFHASEQQINERFRGSDQQNTERIHGIDRSLQELRTQMERQHAELLKWSFLFWVGAVGAIAALAGVLKP